MAADEITLKVQRFDPTADKLPYWQSATAEFRNAAMELPVKYEVAGPETYDPKAEHEEFQRVLNRQVKPSGILVSSAAPDLIQADIDAAIAASEMALAPAQNLFLADRGGVTDLAALDRARGQRHLGRAHEGVAVAGNAKFRGPSRGGADIQAYACTGQGPYSPSTFSERSDR